MRLANKNPANGSTPAARTMRKTVHQRPVSGGVGRAPAAGAAKARPATAVAAVVNRPATARAPPAPPPAAAPTSSAPEPAPELRNSASPPSNAAVLPVSVPVYTTSRPQRDPAAPMMPTIAPIVSYGLPTLDLDAVRRDSQTRRSADGPEGIAAARTSQNELGTDALLAQTNVLGSEIDRRGRSTPRNGSGASARAPAPSSRERSSMSPRAMSPRGSLTSRGLIDDAVARRRGNSPTAPTLRRLSASSDSIDKGVPTPRLAATTPRMSQARSSADGVTADINGVDGGLSLGGSLRASINGAVAVIPSDVDGSPRDGGTPIYRRANAIAARAAAQASDASAATGKKSQDLYVAASSTHYIDAVTESMAALYVPCMSPQDISRLPYVAEAPPTHVCLRSMPITTHVVANILSYCNRFEIHDLMFDDCVFSLYDYTWLRRVTGLKTIRLRGSTVGTRIVSQIMKHAPAVETLTLFDCGSISSLPALSSQLCRVSSIQLIKTNFTQRALSDLVNCPTVREVMLLNVDLHANIFELFNSDHIEALHVVGCPDLFYTEKDEAEWLSRCSPRAGHGRGDGTLSIRSLIITDCGSLSLHSLPWGEMTALQELSIMHHENQALPIACLHDVFRKCDLRLLRLQHVFVDEYLVRQIQLCTNLQELNLSYCKGFHGMEEIWAALANLRRLNVSYSEVGSVHLAGLHRCRQLEQTFAQHCRYLDDLSVFRALPALQLLDLTGCTALACDGFDGDYACQGLSCVILNGCTRLRDISGLAAISGIEVLRMSGCLARDEGIAQVLSASASSLCELDLSQCSNVYDLGAVPFHRCANLTHVDLSESNAVDATVAALASCPRLFSVNLSRCENVTSVADLGAGSELRHLDLSFSAVTDAGLLRYTDKTGAKYLERLTLRGCTSVGDLSCLGRLKRVTVLDLSASAFDAAASLPAIAAGCKLLGEIDLQECLQVRDLSPLGASRTIYRLNASLTGITDACLRGLAGCQSLEDLELSGCEGLRDVSALAELRYLQRLNLSNTSVVVSSMTKFDQCAQLWDISLANNTEVRDISIFSGFATLQRLDVSGTAVNDRSFASPWRCPVIEEIDLRDCKDLSKIGAGVLKSLVCLRRIDLSQTAINDASLAGIAGCLSLEELVIDDCTNVRNAAALSGLRNLCTLRAAGTCINDASLTNFYRLERLSEVDLSRCAALRDVSALGRCASLLALKLADSGVTDDSFLAVARPTWRESPLSSLDLSGCGAIQSVPAVASLRHLAALDLSRSGVTDEGLDTVAQLPRLRALHLAGCRSVHCAAAIGTMASLKSLDMGGSSVSALTDDGASHLWATVCLSQASFAGCDNLRDVSALRELPALVVLDLSRSSCADESFAGVPWSGCTALQELHLRGCADIRDLSGLKGMHRLSTLILADSTADSDSISGLRDCPSLEEVDMSGCASLKNVAALAELPRLRYLWLQESGITSASFEVSWTGRSLLELHLRGAVLVQGLRGISGLPRLRRLDLAHTSTSDAGVRAVSRLGSLEFLDLGGCRGVRSATSLSHLGRLRVLDLSGSSVDNTTLIALPMCPALEVLDLRKCVNITNAFLAHDFTRLRVLHMPPLARVIGSFISHAPALELLSLQYCPPTPHAATWLAQLPFIKAIDLRGSEIAADFFVSLQACPLLEELDLSECADLTTVAALAQLPHFKRLSLSRTALGNTACADIASCRGLQELSLNHCVQLTDIASLSALKRLRRLDLSATAVGDGAFAVAREMPELEELLLAGCGSVRDSSGIAGAPRLRSLELSHSTIQVVNEDTLTLRCPHLRSIKLDGCNARAHSGVLSAARSKIGGMFRSSKNKK